jgi:NAD(P)-dependent dehydrogenase (short-subunit alcohol dehydrogenase family)
VSDAPAGDAPARSALVTGSSGGIGLAIARLLAESGHSVTLTARRPEKLEAAAAGLVADGLTVRAHAGNIADPAFLAELVAGHGEAYGRLDVLVNNAGVGRGAPVGELRDRDFDLQYEVNLRPVFAIYRDALALLRVAAAEHGNAMVINNASLCGLRPQPFISVYSAVKSAVIAFSASMNRELGEEGIKSTALCLGYVDTEMSGWVKERIPAEEMITVADVVGAVRWLITTSPHCVVPEVQLSRRGDRV